MHSQLYSFSLFFITLILSSQTTSRLSSLKDVANNINLIESLSAINKIKYTENKAQKEKEVVLPKEKDSKVKERELRINNNVIINGSVSAHKIITDSLTIEGEGKINNNLITNQLSTNTITSESLSVNSITSPTGVIEIEGDIVISSKDEDESNDSFAISGTKDFSLLHHDDFEGEVKDWSDTRTNTCTSNGNVFLGGHCKFSYNEVSRTYEINSKHTEIRITASYHMFDNWNGEYGYMKVDNEIVWMREGNNDSEGINVCGGKDNDPAFNLLIDVVVPHTSNKVVLSFGSTLQKDPCDASFGIDDVMLYFK